jgi:hypothetical protein
MVTAQAEGLRQRRVVPSRKQEKPQVQGVGKGQQSSNALNSTDHHGDKKKKSRKGDTARSRSANTSISKKEKSKWPIILICFIYAPFLAVFNPLTLAKWYYMMEHHYYFVDDAPTPKKVSVSDDTRTIAESTSDSPSRHSSSCPVLETKRLIFVRIPKTASTSIMDVFFEQQSSALFNSKSNSESSSSQPRPRRLSILDVGELEGDIVSSIPVDMTNHNPNQTQHKKYLQQKVQGYYDASPQGTLRRRRDYYTDVSKAMVYPPPSSYGKPLLLQGHLHVIDDWPALLTTTLLHVNTTNGLKQRVLPRWLQEAYSMTFPTADDLSQIMQFTFMRHPIARYASMYHFDRHATRTRAWRQQYVEHFYDDGNHNHNVNVNVTLNECLQNKDDCIQQLNIGIWCNLQTQIMCGVSKECDDPTSPAALDKAKQRLLVETETETVRVPSSLVMVGITERLEESLQLLSRRLPSYLRYDYDNKASASLLLPHRRASKGKESLSESSVAILEQLCSNDLQLYKLANDILTKQLNECGIDVVAAS